MGPGERLVCPACETQIVVMQAAPGTIITCSESALVAIRTEVGKDGESADHEDEPCAAQLGKRYEDVESGLVVLCVKSGRGALSCDGRMMGVKATKPLPSSD
jgi:hypothetical protein